MYRQIKKAFTLAEVLTVIGIIGVVATLTLPNLKDSSDEQVNVSKAKKVYSELGTAWDRVSLKYSGNPASNSGIWAGNATPAASRMNKYLKITNTNSAYWFETSTNCKNTATGLADGSSYCTQYYNTTCTDVKFDVDGPKKGMNALGYDVFYASLYASTTADSVEIRPFGCSINQNNITNTTSPSAGDQKSLYWVTLYNNMDYRKCASSLKFYNVTTCH